MRKGVGTLKLPIWRVKWLAEGVHPFADVNPQSPSQAFLPGISRSQWHCSARHLFLLQYKAFLLVAISIPNSEDYNKLRGASHLLHPCQQ